MELELGLKITHTRDDIPSFVDLRIAKDHAGPLFLSRENETMFSLVAYLKGFRKENIDIKINEDGNRITISGKKPVQEMVLIGWIVHKKEVELKAFRKAFQIPDGVILDKIKAKFNDEESTLTIILPKLVKGIRGVEMEEVTEKEVDKGRGEATQAVADEVPEGEYREPEMNKLEEIDQAEQKEMNIREAQTTRGVALELPRKEKDEEALKEESTEPKIRTNQETAQVREQVIDQGQFEAAEEVADTNRERDKSKGILQEKSQEPNIKSKEETEKVVEPKADAGELVPERVVDTTLQKKHEPKVESELEEATPDKAEPHATATAATYQETTINEPKQVKTEKETEHQGPKEPTPAEETKSEELPGLKEEGKRQETPEAKSTHEEKTEEHPHGQERNHLTEAVMDQETKPPEVSSQPSTQADQGLETEANHLVRAETLQESEKQETETKVQEPTIPRSDQEKMLAETPLPAEKSRNDEAQEINNASTHDVVEEHELLEEQKQKDPGEGSMNTKKPLSRRTKLCPPLVVAGSAILVSIIVLVISWIRAKKR
ncbi:unnamed protein product [Dovyalis caffra]|uniref:SHSP domain-containing protein n=1 Tax=Dovyalis caffra TaxID=77055 RepID=A0AAV1SA39_9ROSI|nr:unnamed protein product [Dovyalis caffra]